MKSIDRLREYVDGNSYINEVTASCICSLLDSIEREVGEMQRALTIDAKPMTDENMAESGWVRLPLDADGEPIHVGDVMEWVDPDGEVTVTCTVDAVGVGCFFAWDNANGRFAQKCANAYRHHHEPTVEDVLREFLGEMQANESDPHRTIAEYAGRLRLAGDE